MRIAKSYYGKQATKGVTRLSEGKYRIAERIVFVRLLKGQHVMVRIGGGWDTLQNFLFRHKSDPSQVIDPDDLLPLDAKIMLEKDGPQLQAKQFTRQAPSTPSSSSNLNLASSSVPTTPTSFVTPTTNDTGGSHNHNNHNIAHNHNNILSPQHQQIITNSLKPTTTSPIIIHGSHNGLNHNQMHNYHQISQQQLQTRHEQPNHHQLLSTLVNNHNNNEQQQTSSPVRIRRDPNNKVNNRNNSQSNSGESVRLEKVKLIEPETTHLVDYNRRNGLQRNSINSVSDFGIDTNGNGTVLTNAHNIQKSDKHFDGFSMNNEEHETTNNISITTDGELNSNATNSNKTSNSSSPLTPKLSYGTDGPTSPSTTATSTDMDTGLGCSIASSTTTNNSVNLCNNITDVKQNANLHHNVVTSSNNKSSFNSVNSSNLVNINSTTPSMNNYKYQQKYLRRSSVNRMQQHQQQQQQSPLNFNAKDYLDSRQKLYNDQRSRSTSENVSDIGGSYGDHQQNTMQQLNANTLRNLLINGNGNNVQSSAGGPTSGLKHGRSQQVLIHRLKAPNSTFSKSTLSLNGGFGGSSANLNSPASHRQTTNGNLSSAHMIYGTPMHTFKSSRYPNYLKSSQHITNRAKQNGVPS